MSPITLTPQTVLTAARLLLEFNETAFSAHAWEAAQQQQAVLAETLNHYLAVPRSTALSNRTVLRIEALEQDLIQLMRYTQQLMRYLTPGAQKALREL